MRTGIRRTTAKMVGTARRQSWKSLNRPISTNQTTTIQTIITIITTEVLVCAVVVSPDGADTIENNAFISDTSIKRFAANYRY